MASNLMLSESSRSIKRLLISESSPSSRSAVQKCGFSPELPVLARSKSATSGDDRCGLPVGSSFRWLACLILVTVVGVLILSVRPLSENWPSSVSLSCPRESSLGWSCSPAGEGKVEKKVKFSSTRDKAEVEKRTQEGEKCWSRERHWLYRRTQSHSPLSPLLAGALEDYAHLHARCTVGGTKNWATFPDMEQWDGVLANCRYLIYLEGWEGLGNRLLSLASAFTYALATDRVLLIDSRKNLPGLLCEPFEGSSWKLPTNFPYEKIEALPTLDSQGKVQGRVALLLNLRHEQSHGDQKFGCAESQEQLGHVPWIVWKSNQYYVTRLFMIPAFWKKLTPLFEDPSLAFTQLSRYLLLPQNAIWAKTERIYQAYLAGSRKLVGIQIRTPFERKFSQHVQDRIIKCLLDDAILPTMSQQPDLHPAGSLQVKNVDVNRISLLVASLHRGYYEAFKGMYIERDTKDGSFVSVQTVASEGAENESYNQSVKALVDIWLLSFSDSLVTSSWSTFGYVAQGLGAIYPYIINTNVDLPSSCYGGQSIDPCTHYPFVSNSTCDISDGELMAVDHAEWIQKHLRPCQDQPLGLQLVS